MFVHKFLSMIWYLEFHLIDIRCMHYAYIYIFSNKYKKDLSLLITIQKHSPAKETEEAS